MGVALFPPGDTQTKKNITSCVVPGEKRPHADSVRLSHLRRGLHARVGVGPFFPGDKTWGGGASSAAWLASDRKKSLNMSDGKN